MMGKKNAECCKKDWQHDNVLKYHESCQVNLGQEACALPGQQFPPLCSLDNFNGTHYWYEIYTLVDETTYR